MDLGKATLEDYWLECKLKPEMSMDLGKAILEDYWLECKLKPERGLAMVSRA